MASLRESKKLATRRAIAESTARILLREGFEGLTISMVAKESDVSVRTFHNYFSGIDEALLQFTLDTIQEFVPLIESYSSDMTITEVCEDIAVKGLVHKDGEFSSIATLFQIHEHVSARSRPMPDHDEIHEILENFHGSFAKLYPELSAMEISVSLQAGAATIVWTAAELVRLKAESPHEVGSQEQKEAFIRKAFTTLRAIR